MRRVPIALAVLALLVLAPPAQAGGWATVGLSSTPAGTKPGQPWDVRITVLQHGRTPLTGVQPTVTIRNGDATKTFDAAPAKEPGVYRASVVFPTAGKWTYEVNDGFITGIPHTFPAVEIGRPAPASAPASTTSDGGGGAPAWLAIPGFALLVAAVGLLLLARQRRPHHPQAA